MFRSEINDLIKWKKSSNRKPLILRGARQVGKTWLMKEFGNKYFKKVAYINFENNARMKTLFNETFEIDRLITAIQIESDTIIEPEDTLIIFDEVQEVPKALTSLKYFYENAPQYYIIAAGSLLGIALHPDTSFPVGKVGFLNLYPLSFLDFLNVTGNEQLAKTLKDMDFILINSFKNKYINLLKQYYYVGGMPEVVSSFIDSNDYSIVRTIQNRLLDSYEQDFSKHTPSDTIPRLRMLWNSIPSQLARENRKFIYGLVRQGARAREYEVALQWLIDCGLIYKINRITKPKIPLSAYQDNSAFKIFITDIGLLGALSRLDSKTILEGNKIFEEFKGAFTEQYVAQQLINSKEIIPFYWSAEKGTSEIDFIIQIDSDIFPLEVKASENLQSKSLKFYYQKFSPKLALRTSMSDYRNEGWLINLPLYTINIIKELIEAS